MRYVALLICFVFFTASSFADTLYHERSFFAEKAIDGWAQKSQFAYGYESDFDITHFYSINIEAGSTSASKNITPADLNKYFDSISDPVIKEMYLELYGNMSAINYLVDYYRSKKDWRKYNHFVKKIEPETKKYFLQLDTYVKSSPRCESFVKDATLLKNTARRAKLCQRERLDIIENFQ